MIVVLGLMATLVALDWRAMLPRSELNSTVRALAATISGTRSDSIARNVEFGILYDIDGNSWRVVTPFAKGGGLAASFEDRLLFEPTACKSSVEIAGIWLDGEEYTQNPNGNGVYVRFDPLGGSTGHTVILNQPQYNNATTIEVMALTGQVKMHQGVFNREVVDDTSFSR